jgi:phosphate transport system protein
MSEVRHFDLELEDVHRLMAKMGASAEFAIHRSVQSLIDRDRALAEAVIREEPRINELEMQSDNASTRLLTLYHPVAKDLRFLTVALKISTDLERVGDLAVNIAERVLSLREKATAMAPSHIARLAQLAESMLSRALEALWNVDENQARHVLLCDGEANQLRDSICDELVEYMQRNPEAVRPAIDLIFIARDLERIGDHATNIAEDAVYLARAIDVRHHQETTR